MSKFINYIKEDIEEDGNIDYYWFIPLYRELVLGKKMEIPYFDKPEDFSISDIEFENMIGELKKMLVTGNYKIYFVDLKHKNEKWADNLTLVSKDELEKILINKSCWIYREDNIMFTIAHIESLNY